MRIAIVDDCENERSELCKRLSQSSFSRSYDIEICEYNSGTDFLNEAMQNRFDLVFMDIYMKKENGNDMPFKADEVNWDELSGIGIMKDELELSGEMDTLLRGEKTKVMSLSLVLLGVDVLMDATLQLVRKGEAPLLEIQGVTPLGR